MILTPYPSAQRHNRPQGYAVRYAITARQARNACVIGCVAGLVAMPVLCWLVDSFPNLF